MRERRVFQTEERDRVKVGEKGWEVCVCVCVCVRWGVSARDSK